MALSAQRANPPERWTRKRLLGAASTVFYKGQAVGIETASNGNQGRVVPMSISTSLVYIGLAAENLTNTAAALVNVDLCEEIELHWYANAAASNNVAAINVGSLGYFTDDLTVSKTSTSNSLAGRIWAYDSVRNTVAIQKLPGSVTVNASGAIDAGQVTPGTAYQVLRTNSGATASEWGRAIGKYAAVDLTNSASSNIGVGQVLDITACGDTKALTLATTSAVAGDWIVVTRKAIGATTANTVLNGGSGTGTLMSMTSNKEASLLCIFDGTDWRKVASYQGS
jgi:hypothetical protein